jgi:hypothetical protein
VSDSVVRGKSDAVRLTTETLNRADFHVNDAIAVVAGDGQIVIPGESTWRLHPRSG